MAGQPGPVLRLELLLQHVELDRAQLAAVAGDEHQVGADDHRLHRIAAVT